MIQVSHQSDYGSFTTGHTVPVKTLKFPGGEVGIKIPLQESRIQEKNLFVITAWLNDSDAIMELIMTVDAIRRQRVNPRIRLKIGYLPYARQDRVCDHGESLSIAVMAKLINDLNLEAVSIIDAHSNVALPLINNCTEVTQKEIFTSYARCSEGPIDYLKHDWWLVAPDAGARKKTEALAGVIKAKGIIYADKERDLTTGKILRTNVYIPEAATDNPKLLIVDDICDGGRTFIELAKVIRNQIDVDEMALFVTHGIFSKGFDELFEQFDHVHTTNTFTKNSVGDILPNGNIDISGKFFSYPVL